METECRKWNAISVGECTSRSVEWKGVQSHVESEGWNVTEVCQGVRPSTTLKMKIKNNNMCVCSVVSKQNALKAI